ncbi:MAG: hypothetical protein A2902_07590 [Elusimicrobia bacterium RIFCSPLOWO2_01_FULL_64_13]|nr:MAG: hypothetical protein A2636_00165 [Elusimicrobia bacterium RIFCSPHIGHO2_01_FULL_64_10]OGR94495.1 MAG: hypothetical protein A2902_07590 [Elusimicrobia bacterium RIFCSPLOWO2_01_FULL_64_13]
MVESLTLWIMQLLRDHGAVSVFVGVIIESIIVPIPSPLIIMGAGAILIDSSIPAWRALGPILLLIVLPGSAASTLGAYLTYGVAYWGGKPLIDRLHRFLGFDWKDIVAMEERFLAGRVGLTIFSLRALPIVPLSLISAAAGALRMPVSQFTLWTYLGSVPRCLFLAYLGWFTRDTYVLLARRFDLMEGIVSGLIVLSSGALVLWLRFRLSRAGD